MDRGERLLFSLKKIPFDFGGNLFIAAADGKIER